MVDTTPKSAFLNSSLRAKFGKDELRRKFRPRILVPFFFGALCAVQTAMVGAVASGTNMGPPPSGFISSSYFGAMINVIGGLLISAAISNRTVVRLYAAPNPVERPQFRWWMLLNGVLQAVITVLISLGFPEAGAVLTAVFFVVGSIGVSAVFDHIGFMSIPKRRVSIYQILALLLFLASAILASMSLFDDDDFNNLSWKKTLAFLPLLAGTLFSLFVSINISTSLALPYVPQTTFLNYAVSAPLMCVVWGAVYAASGERYSGSPPWWTYFSGMLEICIIMCDFVFMPKIGIVLYQQFFICGTLSASAFIDGFGLLAAKQIIERKSMRYTGIALAVLGALVSVVLSSDVEPVKPSEDSVSSSHENQGDGCQESMI